MKVTCQLKGQIPVFHFTSHKRLKDFPLKNTLFCMFERFTLTLNGMFWLSAFCNHAYGFGLYRIYICIYVWIFREEAMWVHVTVIVTLKLRWHLSRAVFHKHLLFTFCKNWDVLINLSLYFVVLMHYDKYVVIQQAEHAWEVLVPGDPERRHMVMCDMRGGIPYHSNQIKFGVGFKMSD